MLVAGYAAFGASPALAAPPANNDFASAEGLTGTSATATGTNVDATAEVDEPDHHGFPASASVWYAWTAPADADVTVDTCGSDFDTVLAVYTGTSLSSLNGIASSDDAGPCSPQSEVDFDAVSGTTYRIAVDGYSGATGNIDLELVADVPPPPGPPQTYYVRAGGTGTDCIEADPCGTIADALTAHRVTSGPGDVIDIGAGDWGENVEANQDVDDGLTIRGTLSTGGDRESAIIGTGSGTTCPYLCVAAIGNEDAEVLLRDIEVNNNGTDSQPGPIFLGGASDLDNVFAHAQSGSFIAGIVEQTDEEQGKVIEDSIIDARDSFAVGIEGDGGATVRDSEVHSDYQAIQSFGCGCAASSRFTIVRSWITTTDDGQPAMNMGADLVLDSALVTGGDGIYMQGYGPSILQVDNSTIDAGDPGVVDGGGSTSLEISNQNPDDPIQTEIDSSILVEPLDAADWGGGGTIACTYNDMRANSIEPVWVGDCQPGSNSNTTTDPADLFVGGSPFDWSLKAGAPAIDAGEPGAIDPGLSQTDLAGNPRREPGTGATCPLGTRDMGAYERAPVPCVATPPEITNGAAPLKGTALISTRGTWDNGPADYLRRWLSCDASGDACAPITDYRARKDFTPRGSEVGHTLRVEVKAENAAGESEPAQSAASGVVVDLPPQNITPPEITNGANPVRGTALISTKGTWTNQPDEYLRRWLSCDASGDACTPITDYRARKDFTPRGSEVGHTLRVEVKASNSGGESDPAQSAASGIVAP